MPETNSVNQLLSILKATKHSLALLVCGARACDRRALVSEAVCALLGVQQLESHPNILWLNGEGVNVDSVRGLGSFLYGTAYYSNLPKLAVIENVDKLGIHSLNALLKPLEDLAGNTHIILTACNFKSLPDTILSRCLRIRMKPISVEGGVLGKALELYKEMLALLNKEKNPSAKLYGFIEKNFSSPEELAMFRELMNHLMSKAIKFKAGTSDKTLNDDEQRILQALVQRLSLQSLLHMLASTDAMLINAERFGLDSKSVVLVTLAKLIT
jgi:hypothetical protein